MDEEHSGNLRLGSPLRPLLTYGVPYVGAGVWAFTRFPDQLRWTSEIFARVFGLAAPFYEDLTHVEGYGEALDAALDALEREPERVLDLCCGTGFAARQVQHAFPDAEVIGVDLSPEMVLMARREADEEGLDIEFEVDDARALAFADESFDLVVSHNAPPFPEETMRVLAPSGTALTVWSFGGPWVGLAWPALARRLRKEDALYADGFRAGPGFYGIVEKSGLRRRRPTGTNGSGPPARGGRTDWRQRAEARRTGAPERTSTSSRPPVPVPPRPPAPPPSAGVRAPGRSRPAARPEGADEGAPPRPPTLTPRPTRRSPDAGTGRARPARTAPSAEAPEPPAPSPSLTKRPTPRAARRTTSSPGEVATPTPRPSAGPATPARPSARPATRARTPVAPATPSATSVAPATPTRASAGAATPAKTSAGAAKPAPRTRAKPAAKRATPKAPARPAPAPPASSASGAPDRGLAPGGPERPSASGTERGGTPPEDTGS